jgi:hypothetical protein
MAITQPQPAHHNATSTMIEREQPALHEQMMMSMSYPSFISSSSRKALTLLQSLKIRRYVIGRTGKKSVYVAVTADEVTVVDAVPGDSASAFHGKSK